MAEQSVTKCAGLVTQNNPLEVVAGALVQADNAVVRREDVVENRRGYEEYADTSDEVKQILGYNDRVLYQADTEISADNGSGTFNEYIGTFSEPTDVVTTGTTAASSTSITAIADAENIKLGQIVIGTGIPDNTFVTAIAGTAITISQAATASATVTITFKSKKIYFQEANSNVYVTTTSGVKVLQDVAPPRVTTGDINSNNQLTNLASTVGIVAGLGISGANIPANTYVASISGSTVTMSANATATTVGITVTFTSRDREAGAPRALGPAVALTGASGFLATAFNVAYRIVIQRIDQNDNVLNGYPSERVWIGNNSGGSRNVIITAYLGADVVAGDILQVYRTPQASSGTLDTAGDEEGLVYQQTLTQANILTGSVSITDSVVDGLIGATIYTAPSQQGIAQGNEEPPLAKDIALFKNHMFYANTETKHVLYVNLVGTTNLYNAAAYGRTVIIAGTTYTSAAAENAATGAFLVVSTGAPATDIDTTARSLIRIINTYATNTSVYAYYLTTPDTLPGQIVIIARDPGGSAFTIQVGASASAADFFPQPPTSPNTATESTSSNQVQRNGLSVSKVNEIEAVPGLNSFLVGPANDEILRIAPLRDSLIIIKEDGVYRLTGESIQSFNITPLDLTVFCKAVNSVVVLANNVIMLSNQGVVAISDTGVEVISRRIEPQLLPLLTYANISTYTTGISYESERQYILSTIGSAADTRATQSFIYNIFTRAWTRWTFAPSAGLVERSMDKLFFATATNQKIYIERKSFTNEDYADPEYDITINSISGDVVNFTLGSATPVAGWVIKQGATQLKIISIAQNGSDWNATMASTPPASWVAGAAEILPAISFEIEWDAYTSGLPGYMKQLRMLKILTDNIALNNTVTSLFATFRTDLSTNQESVEINSNQEGWGDAWGDIQWGGLSETFSYPTWPPKLKSYFRVANFGVIHQNALERCSVSGFATTFETISERTNR